MLTMAVFKYALDFLKLMVGGLREMSLRELIVAVLIWAVGLAATLLTTTGPGPRQFLKRLLVALILWAVLTAGGFSYGFLKHSGAAYVGLFFLVGWFFFIPLLLALVSVTWFIWAKVSNLRNT